MEANNMKAMREALELAKDELWANVNVASDLSKRVADALSDPPRNCDVGTPKEQSERFEAFCDSHWDLNNADGGCSGCPLKKIRVGSACEFAWMQMPYEGKEESNEQHQ